MGFFDKLFGEQKKETNSCEKMGIEGSETDSKTLIRKGLALQQDGKYNEAIESFEKARELNPSHPNIKGYIKKARELRSPEQKPRSTSDSQQDPQIFGKNRCIICGRSVIDPNSSEFQQKARAYVNQLEMQGNKIKNPYMGTDPLSEQFSSLPQIYCGKCGGTICMICSDKQEIYNYNNCPSCKAEKKFYRFF